MGKYAKYHMKTPGKHGDESDLARYWLPVDRYSTFDLIRFDAGCYARSHQNRLGALPITRVCPFPRLGFSVQDDQFNRSLHRKL